MSAAETYAGQNGVIAELREQNEHLQRLLVLSSKTIAAMRSRHRKLIEVMTEAHDAIVAEGFEECDKCLGTGGVPLDVEDTWVNEDGETCGTVTRWTHPCQDPCEECDGAGIEF